MRIILTTICVLLFAVNSYSQKANAAPSGNLAGTFFTLGYRLPSGGSIINSGHGIYAEAGYKPLKLLYKNINAGIFAGIGLQDRLWITRFDPDFASGYAAASSSEYNADSAIISASRRLISNAKGRALSAPGCAGNSFHNYSLYAGVIIDLPFKYITGIKLYGGSTRTYIMSDQLIVFPGHDYTMFELRRKMLGSEILLLRYCRKSFTGSFSFYFERADFYHATLYFNDGGARRKLSMTDIAGSSFISKYRNELTCGIKCFVRLR